jgi:hypothetical protein
VGERSGVDLRNGEGEGVSLMPAQAGLIIRELLGVSDMAFWASSVEGDGVVRRQPFQHRRIALAGGARSLGRGRGEWSCRGYGTVAHARIAGEEAVPCGATRLN